MTPQEAGFEREPKFDGFSESNPTWEVWRTPQGALLTLPPRCKRIKLIEVVRKAGADVTFVCVEPKGVTSIWPYKRGVQK